MKRVLAALLLKALYAVMLSSLMLWGVIRTFFTRKDVRKFMQECSRIVYEHYLELCDILED